mmetsp:Transcript_24913/g.42399  ORF Transcript_24913/g.42399 Transcript_24913/m.42399 type:complete len:226 (-) Transcript_24913:94-771(-)
MSTVAASIAPMWLELCGKGAPMASILVFMAPIPTIRRVSIDRSVGNLPLLPYSSMVSSTFVWVVYGILKSEPKVWSANGVGLVLGTYYFLEFIRFSPKRSSTLPGSVIQHFQGILGFLLLCMGLAYGGGAPWVGYLGVALCVAMFASPLAALKVVLETKSAKAIPLPFTIASVVNCFLWSVIGIFDMDDYNIYVPNLLGLLFGLIQVVLKLIYMEEKSVAPELPL